MKIPAFVITCMLGGAAGFAPLAHAVQDCELGGQHVNPANGNTTAGKTGLMRCKDRDSGQLVREQELQNGRFMGLVRYYEDGQLKKEHSVNERGNQQGRAREFAPGGQVLRDAVYDNGDEVGLVRSFYANGQLRRVAWEVKDEGEKANAEFNERGQLSSLRCGDKPQLAPAADDARWCGFTGGASRLELFNSRGVLSARTSYLAGQRIKHEALHDNGQPNHQDEITGDSRVQRYFNTAGEKRREVQSRANGLNSSGRTAWSVEREQDFGAGGAVTRDRRWSDGKAVSEQTFYLNGQPRMKTLYGTGGNPALLETTQYYDSGKVASVERYSAVNRSRQVPVGSHQRFSEDGKLVSESVYDDRGRITREKAWDETGKLFRDDEVFEDGSRKAFSR
ncbi:MAG: hypothetical protein Q7T87_03610 [Polaromonas sp.]|nr:hypothetical protein [Polaromonas sp.]